MSLQMTNADIIRLGRKADRQGVKLYRTLNGDVFAKSVSLHDVVYHTTADSCDCPGFKYVGRCKHIAAFVRRS
jgi:hypothetical protein